MTAAEVSNVIRKRVEDGTYSYRIPATWELAEGFGVGRDTARRAVSILRDEGLLICTGRQFFVKSAWEARTTTAQAAPRCPASVAPVTAEQAAPRRPASVAPVTADDLRRAIGHPSAQFMTVEEFAAFTRMSKMTIYRLIHGGELGSRRIGRDFRIPIDSAVKFLKESGSWS